jgi:hypothetical protein
VPYLPPFNVIKRLVEMSTSKGQLIATVSYENLVMMIKLLLSSVEVNERWYLTQYPDVADAITQGKTPSARQHFIDNGYFEGRLPFPIPVDEDWYKREYPDVAESIRLGSDPSGHAHFVRDGYKEGRLPFQT